MKAGNTFNSKKFAATGLEPAAPWVPCQRALLEKYFILQQNVYFRCVTKTGNICGLGKAEGQMPIYIVAVPSETLSVTALLENAVCGLRPCFCRICQDKGLHQLFPGLLSVTQHYRAVVCSRKQSLLNHGAASFTEPHGIDSHTDLVLEELNCCFLLDYLASPCFLKLSHFLLGTCAINSSWAGASYVLFQTLLWNTSPNSVPVQREGEVIFALHSMGAGRTAPAATWTPPFTLPHSFDFQLFIKNYQMQLFQSDNRHCQSWVLPKSPAYSLLKHPPQMPWCTSQAVPQPNAEQLPAKPASHFCAGPLWSATAAIIYISHH